MPAFSCGQRRVLGSRVFSSWSFMFCGDSVLWMSSIASALVFLIMPKRPYEWRVDSHGCYKLDNAALGLGPRDQSAHLPVFLHLRNTNIPGPSSIMRSEQAQQRKYDRKHNKTATCQETSPMITHLFTKVYVMTLCLSRPYECFVFYISEARLCDPVVHAAY